MKTRPTFTLLSLIFLAALLPAQKAADLVIFNARGESMDPRFREVTAVAVRKNRFIAVGHDAEILALAGPKTLRVNARGAFLMPGFIDSHIHFRGVGQSLRRLKLQGMKSYAEVVQAVVKAARQRKPGEWILGRGWDQNLWKEKSFPHHRELSRLVPDHPVVLTRVDGHALLANQLAMKLAGIEEDIKNPDGGEVLRDDRGHLTGVFVDTAEDLVRRVIPADSDRTWKDDIIVAQRHAFALGITMVHEAGLTRRQVDLLDDLYETDILNMRFYVMLGVADANQARIATSIPPRVGEHEGRLWVRGLKIYADGALGSRGAALLNDYADRRGHRGLLITKDKTLEAISALALERGYQASVHAIGDRANRMVLDTWEKLFRSHPRIPNPRFRIEHAQILHEDDLPRFAELGVIASMQAVHCTSDMAWVSARITQGRAKVGAYAWRSLLTHGAVLCNGTDAPVEDMSPFAGLYAFVTRQNAAGRPAGGWFGDQCLSRSQALYAATMAGAWAAFEENRLGSLTPGKFADFILVDTDLRICPPRDILKAQVLRTFSGGREVYHAPSQKPLH